MNLFRQSAVLATLAAAVCAWTSQAFGVQEGQTILVEEFLITNPSVGPEIPAADLTKGLCADLEATSKFPIRYAWQDDAGDARYVLSGSVSWIAEGTDKSLRLEADLYLKSRLTDYTVVRVRTEPNPISLVRKELAGSMPDLRSGAFSVSANQPGAIVWIDNVRFGVVPFDTSGVFMDKYYLKVTHPDRLHSEQWIEVGESPSDLDIEMRNRPARVTLKTDAEELQVYVDGAHMGMTPLDLEFEEGGTRSLLLKGSGREFHRRLDVRPHRTAIVVFSPTTGNATPQASPDGALQPVKRQRIPFLYRDTHIGLTYTVSVPGNRVFSRVAGTFHNLSGHLGSCFGFIGVRGDIAYGISEYTVFDKNTKTFSDANGNLVPIEWINRVSGGGEVYAFLPLGRRASGRVIYPYGGVGYRTESIEVKPSGSWTSLDGSQRYYLDIKDAISITNSYPYWTAGIVYGNLWLHARRSLPSWKHKTEWTEVSAGVYAPLSRR